jgi:hypothetical protein
VKSFVRVAVLVSLVSFSSVHAAQPAGAPLKGPVAVKQSALRDLETWFRDRIRQLGNAILPASSETDPNCVAGDPNGCTEIDRFKCPIG